MGISIFEDFSNAKGKLDFALIVKLCKLTVDPVAVVGSTGETNWCCGTSCRGAEAYDTDVGTGATVNLAQRAARVTLRIKIEQSKHQNMKLRGYISTIKSLSTYVARTLSFGGIKANLKY